MTELSSILIIENHKINENGILKGKSFTITGKLNGISRAEPKSLIEKNSGKTLSSLNKNIDFLLVGEKPTRRKVDLAKEFGVKIISLDQLKNLLN